MFAAKPNNENSRKLAKNKLTKIHQIAIRTYWYLPANAGVLEILT